MTIFIYCNCGAGLEVESTQLNAYHGEISLTVKRCVGCEEEDYQRGYDDRLADEDREQAENPMVREVFDASSNEGINDISQ